jgi:hypothetical protein
MKGYQAISAVVMFKFLEGGCTEAEGLWEWAQARGLCGGPSTSSFTPSTEQYSSWRGNGGHGGGTCCSSTGLGVTGEAIRASHGQWHAVVDLGSSCVGKFP